MRPSRVYAALLVCVLAVGSVPRARAAPGAPFTVEDLVILKRVGDPQVSPDGRHVAYVQRETDLEAGKGRTSLWLLDLTRPGGAPLRLTDGKANDSSPRWASDSRALYFLSERSGSSQVWKAWLASGEVRRVTDYPLDVGSLKVSPLGNLLALSMAVFPDCPDLACTRSRLDSKAKDKASGRLYDRLFVRHWDTWSDGTRSHLFSVRLGADGKAGVPTDLSRSFDADIPGKPFGGDEDYAFSPDGARLVFSARVAGRTEPWSTNFDLYQVPVDGSAPPVDLTAANPAWDAQPVFLPNGDLAWLAQDRPGFESDRFQVMLRSARTGAVRSLTASWDRSVGRLGVARDGQHLLAAVDDLGQRALYSIDARTGTRVVLIGKGEVADYSPGRDAIVVSLGSLAGPADLYSIPSGGGAPRRLTDVNRELLAARRLSEFEQFDFKGWNEETVYGYVMKPYGFQPGGRFPVAFIVHGGPQGSMGNEWHYRWNMQVFAGHGYGVVGDRFSRLDRLRPGIHRFHQPRLGRQAPRRSAQGARRGTRALSVARRRARVRARRLLRRLHDELDRGQLAGPLPLHREPRRCLRPADDVLRHRGAVVPGVGDGRRLLRRPAALREVQSGRFRRPVAHADARHPRRAGLPHPQLPGARRLHRSTAARHREPPPRVPEREPLGAEARQQHPVAPRGIRLARHSPEGFSSPAEHSVEAKAHGLDAHLKNQLGQQRTLTGSRTLRSLDWKRHFPGA